MARIYATGRVKVLSLAHSTVNRAAERVRYEVLASRRPEIDLTLVAPDRWRDSGRNAVKMPLEDNPCAILDFRGEPVSLPWLPKVGWYLHSYPGLRRLLNELQPNVIHLWEEPQSLVAWQAGLLRDRLLPASAFVLETDTNILRRLPPPFQWFRSQTLKQADFIIGRHQDCLDVQQRCGYVGPTAIVEYGVNKTVHRPLERSSRRKNGGEDLVLGYVGRVLPQKGLDDVVAAIASSGRNIMLHVLGDGPDRERIAQMAVERKIEAHIQFFDPRPADGVAEFMNSVDCLVLMSRATYKWKEQFGRVIIEAQACGIPVIGSDSGAIPSVIGVGGWIVPNRDSMDFSRLLQRLDDDRAEIKRVGALGFEQSRTRYSMDKIVDDLADSFLEAWRVRQRHWNLNSGT